jgi:hypothetical protein
MKARTVGDVLCSFKASAEPEIELLAFSLELRKLLKSDHHLIGRIPKSVFQTVSESIFQELIFDTLSPLSERLDDRLQLKVHNSDFFEIAIHIQEARL